jgi:hypothetical protein
MNCSHCGRHVEHPVMREGVAYGPTCARNLFGTKPSQVHVERHVTPDERQGELWPGLWARVRGAFGRIGRWLGGEDH